MEARSNPLYAGSATRDKGQVKSLKSLFPFLSPYRGMLALGLVALIFTSGSVLGLGAALRFLVDNGISAGNVALLNESFFLLMGVVLVLAFATFARFYFVSSVGERVTADIRNALYARVIALDVPFFERTRTGELLSRMTADTTLLQTVLTGTISVALRNGLMLIGGTILLATTSGRLTATVFLMLPVVILPIVILGKKVRFWSRESQSRLADVSVRAEETIFGIRTIQSLSLEAHERGLFNGAVSHMLAASLTRIRLRGWLTAIVIGLVFGAVITVLWMGGRYVLSGHITPGELSSFVFYAVVVAGATGSISDIIGDLQRAAGAAERIVELLDERPGIASPVDPARLVQPVQGALAFEEVTLHYPSRPERPALDGFSLFVRPGETVALVGPSGAGKTTVLQLLLRFYEASAGRILVDGQEVRDLALEDLRRQMGLVPQDPVIFSTSVADNIRLGRLEATDADIAQAAEQAAAMEFIAKLPDGMATHVGEKGVRLSGGQRQRIAIARALLRNPRILLLDEATSALDAESERLVQQAITRIMADRTVLVIAHRLATVKRADRIVVLDEGRIDAIGTHEQLLHSSALYARLAALQFTS